MLLGPETVRKKWGVDAERIGDLLSLVGDHVDNIPGVAGLGPKGAASLILSHGNLDAILAAPDIISNERLRKRSRRPASRSSKTARWSGSIKDLPLPVPLEELELRPALRGFDPVAPEVRIQITARRNRGGSRNTGATASRAGTVGLTFLRKSSWRQVCIVRARGALVTLHDLIFSSPGNQQPHRVAPHGESCFQAGTRVCPPGTCGKFRGVSRDVGTIDQKTGSVLEQGSGRADLAETLENGDGVEGAVRTVVHWRQAERFGDCLDRHLSTGRGKTRRRLIWEGEPGENRVTDLFSTPSRRLPIRERVETKPHPQGDRAIIYLPMIPELPMAMLACARIGVTHSVVFGGFSAESIRDRIADCGAIR